MTGIDINMTGASRQCLLYILIPAKPLHNSDIASEHLNNFPRMKICDTIRMHLCMPTYI